ncbi:MAG: HEAT repeat domain-containing protein [Planctomycetes bacterium]|nr:HEAT repeat domain-containing protein [Planctomycetota bacterium]
MKQVVLVVALMAAFGLMALDFSYAWCPSGGSMRLTPPPGRGDSESPGGAPGVQSGSARGLWETWWDTNKDKYLDYKKPFPREVFEVKVEGSSTESTELGMLRALFEQALKDGDFNIRLAAAIAIGRTGDIAYAQKLRPNLADPEREVSDSTMLGIGMIKDTDSIQKIAEKLMDPKGHEVTRGFAAYALGYMRDPKAIDALKKILDFKSEDPQTLWACTLALGLERDPALVPYVGEILLPKKGKKEDSTQKAYAALALGRLGGDEAMNLLIKAFDKEKDNEVLRSIAIGLGMIGNPGAKDTLVTMIKKGKDELVRGFALIALAQTKAEGSYEIMLECANDKKSDDFKAFGIIALGILNDAKAVPELKKVLADKRAAEFVKNAALIALGMLKAKDTIKELMDIVKSVKESETKRDYTLIALGMIGDEIVVPEITELFKNSDKTPNIYRDCCYSLAMLGQHKVVLEKMYKDYEGGNADIKALAVLVLGKIGDKGTVVFLKNRFEKETNKSNRLIIVASLGYLADPNRITTLRELTADNNYQIKFLSIDHVRQIP